MHLPKVQTLATYDCEGLILTNFWDGTCLILIVLLLLSQWAGMGCHIVLKLCSTTFQSVPLFFSCWRTNNVQNTHTMIIIHELLLELLWIM